MHLKLKNIGIVADADIELDSISVIAGVNNSGKSTVGKVLYSISTVQNMISQDVFQFNKYESMVNDLKRLSRWINFPEYNAKYEELEELYFDITSEASVTWRTDIKPRIDKEKIALLDRSFAEIISLLEDKLKDDSVSRNAVLIFENLKDRFHKSTDEKSIKLFTLEEILSSEFGGQFISANDKVTSSRIELVENNGDTVDLIVQDKVVDYDKSVINISRDYANALYFDDPFLLEDYRFRIYQKNQYITHRMEAFRQLNRSMLSVNYFDKNIQNANIQRIFSQVLDGRVTRRNRKYFFHSEKLDSDIAIESLSAGMKYFSMMQILMESGLLNSVEYLILDEPETHLHPEWQVRFAELVVLISLEYSVRILVTSHSPYFIEAIDLYSKKYHIDEGVRFYFSSSDSIFDLSKISDVTDDLDIIYKSMYKPLNFLEELRDEVEES